MNYWLLSAAAATGLAAILHLGCIAFGATWYRFFGAGEAMAKLAEQGSWRPTLVTLVIFIALSLWTAYALAGAQLLPKLPLLKLALVLISCIFLLRGIGGFWFVSNPLGRSPEFWIWSSLICASIGLLYLVGTLQVWKEI